MEYGEFVACGLAEGGFYGLPFAGCVEVLEGEGVGQEQVAFECEEQEWVVGCVDVLDFQDDESGALDCPLNSLR